MMQPLEQSILDTWPAASWSQTRILIAVSGGADSVALLRAMVRLAERPGWIHVAHFNHQWRGEESDRDQAFVDQLCNKLSLPIHSVRADEFSGFPLQRSEQSARGARYDFLTRTAYEIGARYVVTAHTASDRVETMLHNLCRGTGLNGVATPTRFRSLDQDLVLARPLLQCSRQQVLDYLSQIGQTFCNDSSNLNTAYKRNFIRHELLPLMKSEYGEHVHAHLSDFSCIAEEATQSLRYYAKQWLDTIYKTQGKKGELLLPHSAFRSAPWPVIQMALEQCWRQNGWPQQAMTRTHWLQLRDLAATAESSLHWLTKLNLPGGLTVSVKSDWIRICSSLD